MGEGGGGIKKAGLLRHILKYDFSGDFLDRLSLWESLTKLYNKRQEPGKEFDEDILVATVVEGSTGDLRKQLVARHNEFDTYHKMASFIREYHDCSRAFVLPNTGKKAAKKHNDPMDIDAMGKGGQGRKEAKPAKARRVARLKPPRARTLRARASRPRKEQDPARPVVSSRAIAVIAGSGVIAKPSAGGRRQEAKLASQRYMH
jgi:hypothetical protein